GATFRRGQADPQGDTRAGQADQHRGLSARGWPVGFSAVRAVLRTAAAILPFVLAGCGFHLQGRTPLPQSMRSAYVQATDQQSDFVQSLNKALLRSGARPPDSKESASAVVNILKDEVTRRVLSVSAFNRPNEYEVTYTVRF